MAVPDYRVGDWCWMPRQASACRVVDRQEVWGQVSFRVWLPGKDTVLRARAEELTALEAVQPTADQVLHAVAGPWRTRACWINAGQWTLPPASSGLPSVDSATNEKLMSNALNFSILMTLAVSKY